jgi:hypothetical protein
LLLFTLHVQSSALRLRIVVRRPGARDQTFGRASFRESISTGVAGRIAFAIVGEKQSVKGPKGTPERLGDVEGVEMTIICSGYCFAPALLRKSITSDW